MKSGVRPDLTLRFDRADVLWRPRHTKATRLITADHITAAIATVPGFQAAVPINENGASRKDT